VRDGIARFAALHLRAAPDPDGAEPEEEHAPQLTFRQVES